MNDTEAEQQQIRAEADAVCAADPLQAAIRDELLHIESHATEDGYNVRDISNTHIYHVVVNPTTNEATSMPLTTLTNIVRWFAVTLSLQVPQAMEMITTILANPELSPERPGADVIASIELAVNEYTLADGWEVYGIGVISLAHSMRADAPGVQTLTPETMDENDPDLRACWFTHLLGRDSRIWTVMHQEGLDLVYGTSGADEAAPGVPELDSLTRLVNMVTEA